MTYVGMSYIDEDLRDALADPYVPAVVRRAIADTALINTIRVGLGKLTAEVAIQGRGLAAAVEAQTLAFHRVADVLEEQIRVFKEAYQDDVVPAADYDPYHQEGDGLAEDGLPLVPSIGETDTAEDDPLVIAPIGENGTDFAFIRKSDIPEETEPEEADEAEADDADRPFPSHILDRLREDVLSRVPGFRFRIRNMSYIVKDFNRIRDGFRILADEGLVRIEPVGETMKKNYYFRTDAVPEPDEG